MLVRVNRPLPSCQLRCLVDTDGSNGTKLPGQPQNHMQRYWGPIALVLLRKLNSFMQFVSEMVTVLLEVWCKGISNIIALGLRVLEPTVFSGEQLQYCSQAKIVLGFGVGRML